MIIVMDGAKSAVKSLVINSDAHFDSHRKRQRTERITRLATAVSEVGAANAIKLRELTNCVVHHTTSAGFAG